MWTKDTHRGRRNNISTPKVRSTDADQQRLEQRLDRLEGNLDKLVSTMMSSQNTLTSASFDPVPGRNDENKNASRGTHLAYDANVTLNRVDSQTTDRGKRGLHPPLGSEMRRGSTQNKITCWTCNREGHLQRNCPQSKHQSYSQPKSGNKPQVAERKNLASRGSKGFDKDPVYLKMNFCGKDVPCLLDTGCDITLVPKALVESSKYVKMVPASTNISAANGTETDISGEVTIPLLLKDRCFRTYALVSPDVDEIMLGADWLHQHNCVWDFANRQIIIDGDAPIPLIRRRGIRCRRVFLQDDALLPPKQEINIHARSTIVAPSQSSSDYTVDAHRVRPGLYVGRTLLPATHRNLRIRMVNTTLSPQFLPSGTCVGSLSPVDVVDDTSTGANANDGKTTVSRESAATNKAPPADVVTSLIVSTG